MMSTRPNRPHLDDMLRLPVDEVLALPPEHLALLQGDAATALERLLTSRSVRHGDFVLAAGKHSSYYIDARLTTMSAEGQVLVGRLGLDPDNYGIPLLTSTMDLVGAIALIIGILLVGVA